MLDEDMSAALRAIHAADLLLEDSVQMTEEQHEAMEQAFKDMLRDKPEFPVEI